MKAEVKRKLYQALYRKWRPKTFDEVYGQQHITDILKKQVLLGKMSHAYLTGTRGNRQTTCAKLLARAALKLLKTLWGQSLRRCPSCVGIENAAYLMLPKWTLPQTTALRMSALERGSYFTASRVKRRVYIVDRFTCFPTPLLTHC